MTNDKIRIEFEGWYLSEWTSGETTAIHNAHKSGCWQAWNTPAAHDKQKLVEVVHLLKGLEGLNTYHVPLEDYNEALAMLNEMIGE